MVKGKEMWIVECQSMNVFLYFCVSATLYFCISPVNVTNDKRQEDKDGRMPVNEGKNCSQCHETEDCCQSEHLFNRNKYTFLIEN